MCISITATRHSSLITKFHLPIAGFLSSVLNSHRTVLGPGFYPNNQLLITYSPTTHNFSYAIA